MSAKEAQLTDLLCLMAHSMTHLSASMTSMSFDLLKSSDPAARTSGRRMIVRMEAALAELDQQWEVISRLTGVTYPGVELEQMLLSSMPQCMDASGG